MKRIIISLAVALLAAPASAELVTFDATGPVTWLVDPYGYTGGATTWALSFTFDSDTPDQPQSDPPDPQVGRYYLYSWAVEIGGWTFTEGPYSEGDTITVIDKPIGGPDYDEYRVDVGGWFDYDPDGIRYIDFQLYLLGGEQSVFGDNSLPLTPPPLGRFSQVRVDFQISYQGQPNAILGSGIVTSFIPVPGTLAAFLFLLPARRRRA